MRILVCCLAVAAVLPGLPVGRQTLAAQRSSPRTVTEELVEARADDGILNSGAMFTPANGPVKPVAVIWVHGTGVNFYSPTYVTIARELAARGFATITVNTRMHDLGNVEGFRGETRIRGGSYWGVTTEQVRDLAAWIDFANRRGFSRVVLAGHSAGTTAVQLYQAQRQDARVAGLVLASGRFRPASAPPVDSGRLAQAARLVAAGRGDEAPQNPDAPRPSVTSAATLLDLASMGPLLTDFFGVQTPNAPVTRIRCPILAWFGTKEADIGTAADLALLETTLKRHSTGPSQVTTVMIQNAGHMLGGEEAQAAQTLAKWVDDVVTEKN
jgi:pimeloyl-ACP methyl ester carboxylesterase